MDVAVDSASPAAEDAVAAWGAAREVAPLGLAGGALVVGVSISSSPSLEGSDVL